MKLHDFLNQYPPWVVRAFAHTGPHRLTDRDIARSSGMSTNTVWRVSHRDNWNNVSVWVASQFIWACKVDILRPRRFREYVASGKFAHWKENPKYYKRLVK